MSELFLLDANDFITPYRTYFPLERDSNFWNQMEEAIQAENVLLLDVVLKELKTHEDELSDWISSVEGANEISIKDQRYIAKYAEVLQHIQKSEFYNEKALRAWSKEKTADPWLIAVGIERGATIITLEESAGSLNKANPSKNPKIPDVARHFDVKCESLYYFLREMNFKL